MALQFFGIVFIEIVIKNVSLSNTFRKSSKKYSFSSFLCLTGHTDTPKLNLLNILPKKFYHVEIKCQQMSNEIFYFNLVGKTSSVNFLVLNCLFLNSWCQIVLVPSPNCPGAKLSVFNSWCQIVCFWLLVPNCLFLTLGAKLFVFNSWCQIVWCQIVL